MSGPPWMTRPVGEHAEDGEDLRQTLDLVEDHEAPKSLEREERLGEAAKIGRALEIEERRRSPEAGRQLSRQGALSDLSGTEQRDDRGGGDEPSETTKGFQTLDHEGRLPCLFGVGHRINKVDAVDATAPARRERRD